MTAPRIRLAQLTDVAELQNLEEMARRRIADERGGERLLEVTPPRDDQWFAEGYVTLVALIDDVPVGFLSMRTGAISFIEGVFVHPDAREVGCGDALVDEARNIAKERGGRRLEAIALPGDRETKNLYERAAITAKAITVAVDLSDPSS
ncbi:MAG: GNAT family N-acetyltransferase [Actinomycetota bacterium]|nr:GNAT family N-acetyltransferase [Actinomycetota bacterium]